MTRRLRTVLILTWTVGALAAYRPTAAQSLTPVLVELFTSEGCSSCPAADQLLSELVRTQPVPGVRIIALSEHVDYWDHQGWKDPFSNAGFTRRQQEHAGPAASDVYTPQILVDGGPGIVGSDRAAVLKGIREASGTAKATMTAQRRGPVQPAAIDGNLWLLDIEVPADARTAAASVFLAVTEDALQSSVQRGENAGRELKHDGVARRLVELGRADRTGAFKRAVSVSMNSGWKLSNVHVVAFAQSPAGKIVAIQVLPVPR
jgi:hypothetical protein